MDLSNISLSNLFDKNDDFKAIENAHDDFSDLQLITDDGRRLYKIMITSVDAQPGALPLPSGVFKVQSNFSVWPQHMQNAYVVFWTCSKLFSVCERTSICVLYAMHTLDTLDIYA